MPRNRRNRKDGNIRTIMNRLEPLIRGESSDPKSDRATARVESVRKGLEKLSGDVLFILDNAIWDYGCQVAKDRAKEVARALNKWTIEEVREDAIISIVCEVEHTPIRGNASDSGDEAHDREVENTIAAHLADNPWAWCLVRVIAEYEGVTGYATLGCCSYQSEEEFRKDAYYTDLVNDALKDLMSKLNERR